MMNLPQTGWQQRREALLHAVLQHGGHTAAALASGAGLCALLAATSDSWAGSVGVGVTLSVTLIVCEHAVKKKKKKRKNKRKKRTDKSAGQRDQSQSVRSANAWGDVNLVHPNPPPRQSGPPAPKTIPPNPCEYRVWFGTDRRPHVPGDHLQGFGRRFDDRLHFGSCVVHIPRSHVYASTGSGGLVRCLRVALGQRKDEPLQLLVIEQGSAQSFVDELSACMTQLVGPSREILLYLHGYNVSFKDAAIRAAQIGRDLGIAGPVVFFSWPSFAMAPFYAPDEASIDRTRRGFIEFIRVLNSVLGLRAVNVIAHSMGNRILEQTASVLVASAERPAVQFGHLVLAAPDVDRGVIIQAAEDYAKLRSAQHRTTLYWNRSDRAVALSGLLHRNLRGGQCGAGIPNTDSILWTSPGFSLDLLGHGYSAGAEPVLRDIQQLLTTHAPPSERDQLTPVPSDFPKYWKLAT
jgi:esterase/lipase superfamily enzyme